MNLHEQNSVCWPAKTVNKKRKGNELVAQGSGFETNTSASNIIDRWTREACAIIVRHNNRNNTDLPMPELPARAYCAGMASSCYVLKAVDVEMLMLPGVLKDDLRFDSSMLSPSAVVPADQPGLLVCIPRCVRCLCCCHRHLHNCNAAVTTHLCHVQHFAASTAASMLPLLVKLPSMCNSHADPHLQLWFA